MEFSKSRTLPFNNESVEKTAENEKFKNWFKVNSDHDKVSKPRACKENPNKRLQPVTFRTRRYEKSPIPYLTNLLNENT